MFSTSETPRGPYHPYLRAWGHQDGRAMWSSDVQHYTVRVKPIILVPLRVLQGAGFQTVLAGFFNKARGMLPPPLLYLQSKQPHYYLVYILEVQHKILLHLCVRVFIGYIYKVFCHCPVTEPRWPHSLSVVISSSSKRHSIASVWPPPGVPAMSAPTEGSHCFQRSVQADTKPWASTAPGERAGCNRVHLHTLCWLLLLSQQPPGPWRLTLHSHSTWDIHVLCSFC